MNSSSRTPISAPISMNSLEMLSGEIPPLPNARPASRYRGMEEKLRGLEMRASTDSPKVAAPTSMKIWAIS
jgi:hypothetical protein